MPVKEQENIIVYQERQRISCHWGVSPKDVEPRLACMNHCSMFVVTVVLCLALEPCRNTEGCSNDPFCKRKKVNCTIAVASRNCNGSLDAEYSVVINTALGNLDIVL